MNNNENEFHVWIGCLACYNNGRLVGEWYLASEAGGVTTKSLHAAAGIEVNEAGYPLGREAIYGPHEEFWVMDTDNAPKGYDREMDPMTAQAVADRLAELDDYNRDAFVEWCGYHGYDLVEADVSDFEDAFCGEYDSEEDYAQELAEDLGVVPQEFSWPASYVDWERAARDLFMDYTSLPAPGGGIYVFRD